jgi:hypothetical protein
MTLISTILISNDVLGESYVDIVKEKLSQLDDDLLSEDVDILCRYIVIRFLKTSLEITPATCKEDIERKLREFVNKIWPYILAFVCMVNSTPFLEVRCEA